MKCGVLLLYYKHSHDREVDQIKPVKLKI